MAKIASSPCLCQSSCMRFFQKVQQNTEIMEESELKVLNGWHINSHTIIEVLNQC